ncbi:MAG: riboflavin synthase [Candidatus Aminicenantales bacterium]
MFTGIIRHLGFFVGYRQNRRTMIIEAPDLPGPLTEGESVAVNGVCLTVETHEASRLTFHLSLETLAKTNLGELRPRDLVNLELPLTLQSFLSGHFLTGHVDGTGVVKRVERRDAGLRLSISFPSELEAFLVPKGSVGINGVSLTVASLLPSHFEVELIPLTLEKTNLGRLRPGDRVNLEGDIIGKYVYNYLSKK